MGNWGRIRGCGKWRFDHIESYFWGHHAMAFFLTSILSVHHYNYSWSSLTDKSNNSFLTPTFKAFLNHDLSPTLQSHLLPLPKFHILAKVHYIPEVLQFKFLFLHGH
jgi:hypothetical protein